MNEESRGYRTLKGFVDGAESSGLVPETKCYVMLRIVSGDSDDFVPLDFAELDAQLGVTATTKRRRGEKPGPRSPETREDVWLYRVPVDELRGMQVHMDAAWALLSPKMEYLRALKQRAKVEVLLGYSSNVDHGGFNIHADSLRPRC
ncbi:MAG: DUF4279 domain-containing protein [Polyangiaceae bacterium]